MEGGCNNDNLSPRRQGPNPFRNMTPRSRLLAALVAVLTLLAPSATAQGEGRTIVLGMDGADAETAGDWMDQGLLPNFSRLRDMGTFAPLNPANPAQSPVSWATLNTGVNPGKHGIFDFVAVNLNDDRRRPVVPGVGFQTPMTIPLEETDLPNTSPSAPFMFMGIGVAAGLIAFLVLRKKMVVGAVVALALAGGGVWYGLGWMGVYPEAGFSDWQSLRQAPDYWEQLDAAGVPFRGQGTIVSYPVQELENGKLVAGLGAPDATGGLNSSAIYTTADSRVRQRGRTYTPKPAYSLEDAPDMVVSGGKAGTVGLFKLTGSGGTYESKIFGPVNGVLMDSINKELASLESGGDRNRQQELSQLRGNDMLKRTWVPMSVSWQPGAASVELTVDGSTQTVELGSWSDFFPLSFKWSKHLSTSAMVRIWAEEADGELELFTSPLQIDPADPLPGSRSSWPPSFAADLKERIGAFETLGWACQTHAVKDAELSDDAFLGDIEFTLDWRTRMLEDAMASDDWKVLFHFFGTPDRICHMLMRHMDPLHPQYVEELASREVTAFGRTFPLKDAGLAIYQEMDDIVGWMLDEAMEEGDTLMIVSDHGFDSFRRQVDLNAWLVAEGFQKLDNISRLGLPKSARDINTNSLGFIEWEETQAYSIAIGKIYLNRRGREFRGTVAPDDVDRVTQEIVDRLYEMTDPETGEKMVEKVWLRDELYDGPYVEAAAGGARRPNGAPEITIDFKPGYRASWKVTGGGIGLVDTMDEEGEAIAGPGPFVFDNDSPWSGDHCGVDIMAVQGIFFSNRPMALPEGDVQYDATHLAPTVLSLHGVPIPENYDSRPLRPE